jgi:CheY-like chemotaxis protein
MSEIKQILLAEDSPQDVEMTLAALGEHNLANEVVVVDDGEGVLDYLYLRGRFAQRAAGNPAFILLDLKMPKVDGLAVLRTIKKDPPLSLIPVIMLTSSREEFDLAQCYALGANAYVVKPIDFASFMDAVKQLGIFWAVHNQPPPGSVRKST